MEGTGAQVPGVSAINGVIHKAALERWKIKNAAAYAADHIDLLAKCDRDDAITLVTRGSTRDGNAAANRGTEIHAYAEKIMRAVIAGTKPKFQAEPEDMKYLRNLVRWKNEFDIRPVAVELAVWSELFAYAGRLDLLAWVKVDGDWHLSIVDYKTGESGVWPDAAIQQTAYIHTDHYVDDDSGKLIKGWPLTSMPGQTGKQPAWKPRRAFALWLRPDGYAFQPLDTGDATWQEFVRRRNSYEWELKTASTVVLPAINANPLRKKWKGNK